MFKTNLFIFLLFFLSAIAFPQNSRVKIQHYNKNDFNADAQFWTVCENTFGTTFFGNNDGVLIYDGEHWQKIILPNNSSVRSLTPGKNGIIYAGGYNEAGTIQQDINGQYYYTSSIEGLHLGGKNVENIWDIQILDKSVIYRTDSQLIIMKENIATHLPSASKFIFSAKVGNNYYVQEAGQGIIQLKDNRELNLIFNAEAFNNQEIASLLPGEKNTLIAVTTKGLLYSCNTKEKSVAFITNIFSGVAQDQVTSAVKSAEGNILISTIAFKIIVYKSDGVVETSPEVFSGLEQNVIHRLYKSRNDNLWVLQNNGLAYADFKSPYVSLFNKASVYDVLLHDNVLYLATAQGVYYAAYISGQLPLTGDFKKVNGLQGQTWSIQLLDGDIIISHDSGLYKLEGATAIPIGNVKGFWKITPVGNNRYYLASHYNGLYLLEKLNGVWKLKNKIDGFNESARDILPAKDPGSYWVCHGYQGVFRIHINPDYTRITSVDHFTDKNGLTNAFNINVFPWQNEIVFTTNNGIYTFDKSDNRFRPYDKLNEILDPDKNTRKIIEYGNKTWFVQDDEAGYFYTNDKKPELYKDLFLNIKGTFNRGVESINALKNNQVLFGTSNGLFLYNTKPQQHAEHIATQLTGISYTNGQKLNLLPLKNDNNNVNELPNQTNILRFDFASPKMPHGTQVQYSYKLNNVDSRWSAWQSIPYKEYTHLRPGDYTFSVKSRNTAGVTGKPFLYNFTIKPKWYQTTLAYIIYIIAGLLIIWGMRVLIKMRIKHERDKSRKEAEQAKKLLELEVQQLKLQRDKEAIHRDKAVLEEDVLNKSKELANYTMMLVQKKDIFSEITNDLKELKEYVRNEDSRKKLLEIFRKLNQHKIGEEYMEVFDVNFEKVHHNFFEQLKYINASLTKRELRICAFVKMNLSNKEIAPLLGISLRGVENARYRIRKKLNVATDENFTVFLQNIVDDKEKV